MARLSVVPSQLLAYNTVAYTMSFHPTGLQWNEGELEMHNLLHVPQDYNPTSMFLSPFAGSLLARCPLVAVGTLDAQEWPWTSLWGGEPGFSRPVAQGIIGVKTTVDRIHDPVVNALLGDAADGEVVQEKDGGKMVSALAIDLQSRKRVKLYGRSVAGAVSATQDGIGEVQLVVKIEQSLGLSFSPVESRKYANMYIRELSKVSQ